MAASKAWKPRKTPSIEEIGRLGLAAGAGRFPFLLSHAARELDIPVTAFAIPGITDPTLEDQVDRLHWIDLGHILSHAIKQCHQEDIHYVVIGGRVAHNSIWKYRGFDGRSLRLLGRVVTRRADGILGAVAGELENEGIHLVEQSLLLGGCMPEQGLLTPKRPLSPTEREDIDFGFGIAREIARLDIGQTVIVKDKAIVAVEGLEGTDKAILRAGELADGNIVVVKVAKPQQDSRFDIPVVGPDTIRTIHQAGDGVLAVMSNETLFFDRSESIELAHRHSIGIVAL